MLCKNYVQNIMNKNTVANALAKVLADTFALSLKTQNYHWNVEAPNFKDLHLFFDELYNELAGATDKIAELIRALGEKTPATLEAYSKMTKIKPGNENASASQMLQDLAQDNDHTIQQSLLAALSIAQQEKDEVTANFLIERLTVHQKAAWMLKSSLK